VKTKTDWGDREEDIVTGAPENIEQPFLERAKKRWPKKSDKSRIIF
jgi:hypothetical protein